MNKLASQIDSLNKHLIGSLHTSYPFGLAHGKMGLLIYLYHLYDYTQEAIYKEKAERLLDDLLENDLSKNAELTVEEGLCGVALGLDYIVKKQFVDGDINDLLSGIDDLLFKKLVFGNMESRYSLSQLIHFLYYIYKRDRYHHASPELCPDRGSLCRSTVHTACRRCLVFWQTGEKAVYRRCIASGGIRGHQKSKPAFVCDCIFM